MELTCGILALLMLWEYFRMTVHEPRSVLCLAGYALAGLLIAGMYGWISPGLGGLILPIGLMILAIFSLAKPHPIEDSIKRVAIVLFGVLYCATLFPFLGKLRVMEQGMQLAVIALFCTWGGDTAAYFAGRFFGKRKLYVAISPKKTMEGAAGGIVGGIAVAFVIQAVLGFNGASYHLAAMGAGAALMGIFGDLIASMLKRSTNTKDSSNLIPGHGGVLDRFDGVMFAAPAVYTYVILFLS